MKLLGHYNSKLQAFHYEELLDLYKLAIARGEFAGNKTFDVAAVTTLISQSEDFAALPTASAGQRSSEESLNTPINLLEARFNALVKEASDFEKRSVALISVLEKDTILLDQLLAGANLNDWVAERAKLIGATKFSWDFGMGNGVSSEQISKTDPSNGVIYSTPCPTNTYVDIVDADQFEGLVAPENLVTIDAKNLHWSWIPMTSGEKSEDIYGDGWAQLNLLEDHPLVNFLPDPSIQTILPIGASTSGIFSVTGNVISGSLPIYVKTVFTPRRNSVMITPVNALTNPGFESGSTGWTIENPLSVQSGASAHTGSSYVVKGTLPGWLSSVTYTLGDETFHDGQEWVSLINGNINHIPGNPGVTQWAPSGRLISSSFPLHPQDRVYIETWVKNLAANGSLNVYLSCLDVSGNEILPRVAVPGVTSADDWTKVSFVLEALSNTTVTSGRLIVSFGNHTVGNWWMDDFRVHLPINLSRFAVNQDDVSVYIPKVNSPQPVTIFFQNEQFVVDDINNITFMDLQDGINYTVRFTESYPAYQCSINEKVFSPIVMLDPDRPYPDDEKIFNPISIELDALGNRTLFPITDETGLPTGLTLQMIGRPMFEYYFQVSTTAQPQYGATAVLEVDLSTPSYINGLTLSPFSTFPIRLTKVEIEPFISDTKQILGTPGVLLDRPLVLTFPTTLLRKIYLTCYQESYNLTEHVVQPDDSLRRDALAAVQTNLPFNISRTSRSSPTFVRGAQYTFGLETLSGLSATPVLPGVFISGPYHFTGSPEVFRFDADIFEFTSLPMTNVYLCWKAYNSSGVIVDSELLGKPIVPGECAIWPFVSPSILDRGIVDHIDLFVKFVIRDKNTVIQRFLLQVRGV